MIANDGIQGTPAAESASDSGTVVAVHGSLFDVQFPANRVPPIFAAIEFIDAGGRGSATGQVIAILEASVVRCVPVIERRLPAVGSSVANLHSAAQTPVSAGSVRSAAAALIDEIAHGSADLSDARLLETGIKVIDLFCPVNKGGSIGIIGDAGAGRIVIAAEILRNATEQNDSLSILTFMQAGQEAHMLMGDKELANAHGPRQTAYFAIDEPRDLSSASVKAASSQLEATVVAARSLGLEGLWPAVDPLRSSSRILAGDAVSEEHRHLAERSRDLLRAYSELKERTHPDDVEALSREDRLTWDRARRLQNFLTQPFFVAEPYTNVPGQRISLADTLAGVTAILDGKTDALPEDALLFTGTLEDAVDRAAR